MSEDSHFPRLPSPETLALIAANVSKSSNEPPTAAVDYALELWRESCFRLQNAANDLKYRDNQARAAESIPRTKEYPAPLDDFLRLIVDAKDHADSKKRFRDFIRDSKERSYTPPKKPERQEQSETEWQEDLNDWNERERQFQKQLASVGETEIRRRIESEVDHRMTGLSENGIADEVSWLSLAQDFKAWWKKQKSAKARKSAKSKRDAN